jgi:hypothetical protein
MAGEATRSSRETGGDGLVERKRVHTKRCGMAKREKCVCICKGARHQELVKKPAPEEDEDE